MKTSHNGRDVSRSLAMVIALAVLIGLNLRPSMAAIGPLIERIQADITASYAQIAWLTSLPVLAMGLGCFIALRLAQRMGYSALIGVSLLLIALADGLRLTSESVASLLLTALAAGIGIAFIQASMPALIKHQAKQQTPLVMGWYIAAIMAGAALSSTLAPRLADISGNWRHGLAVWGLLALLAATAWGLRGQILPAPVTARPQGAPQVSLYRQPRVWTLACFFGMGTAGYTCVLAWLPPYYIGLGWSDASAGTLLGFLTAIEVVSGLLLPALAQRQDDRRPVIFLALILSMAGFVLLALAPLRLPYLTAALLGAGIGGLFPLSLIVAIDHHSSPQRAGAISSIVQGSGYFIAAMSPLAAGMVRDQLGSFALAWASLAVMMLVMMRVCVQFDPRNYQWVIRD
jgi:CP family cyanate transporter-like MFS transporter